MQNEEAAISSAIRSTIVPGARLQPEVIVVDGGSTDKTRSIAKQHANVRVLNVSGGRGAQLNAGECRYQPMENTSTSSW
jgi:glycosyltransferase involved in cell wall biosynthesis